jgi:hypothetical protein
MRDLIIELQPSMYALIGIGTLIFYEHPKLVKKWKKTPPTMKKVKLWRRILSILVIIFTAGFMSILFSSNSKYAIINFAIISTLYTLYLVFFMSETKKYSKP